MQTGVERAVAALAASQHGAFGTRQSAQLGVTAKERRVRIARGEWLQPRQNVLTIAGSPPTWRQALIVGVLSAGAVASHRAAAVLHNLDGVSGYPLEVTMRRGRRGDLPGFVVHHTDLLDPEDLTEVDGIPCTTIARTLVDLGAVLSDDRVEQALDEALRLGASPRWIENTLIRLDRPGPSGTASLRRVLARPDRAGPLPDSRFERLIERIVVGAGLPRPVRQHRVYDSTGRLLGRIDVAWPDIKLGIEATSERWHGATGQRRRDTRRDELITAEGWELQYPSWQDALAPATLIATVTATFRARQQLRERPA